MICLNSITLHVDKQGAYSVEVGALASVVEKSVTEPKLRCESIVDIATFNVRTSNTNQLLELTASAAEHNIDIICIQERRYYNSKQEEKYYDTNNR